MWYWDRNFRKTYSFSAPSKVKKTDLLWNSDVKKIYRVQLRKSTSFDVMKSNCCSKGRWQHESTEIYCVLLEKYHVWTPSLCFNCVKKLIVPLIGIGCQSSIRFQFGGRTRDFLQWSESVDNNLVWDRFRYGLLGLQWWVVEKQRQNHIQDPAACGRIQRHVRKHDVIIVVHIRISMADGFNVRLAADTKAARWHVRWTDTRYTASTGDSRHV